MLSEVIDVAHRWRELGCALKLHPPVLDAIESDRHGCENRLREVLTKWLQQNYDTDHFGEPSWKMLVDAVGLRTGGNNPALARQIAANHNGKDIHVHKLCDVHSYLYFLQLLLLYLHSLMQPQVRIYVQYGNHNYNIGSAVDV